MSQFTQSALNLDDLNWKYFDSLYSQRKGRKNKERLIIGENVSFSLKGLPIYTYQELQQRAATYLKIAKDCAVWLKKTQGGGGTSIKRDDYLRKITNKKNTHLGAKGTDLFIRLGDKPEDLISLAEIQILQSVQSLISNEFREVFFNDLVGVESQRAIREMWMKPSWIDHSFRNENLNHKFKNFNKYKETLQSLLPTINRDGNLTLKRQAPGGHAFFAFETLLNALDENQLPKSKFQLISVIGNGEDLGSTPDGIVLGWVVDKKIPITMITTEKTEIDLKGGQIAVKKTSDGSIRITIIEQAQAKESEQLDLFEKNKGLFNTNVAIFNYAALIPCLQKLRAKIGQEAFEKALAPTLMENKKSQIENDEEVYIYEQLEGAMGSTLLNLDGIWRENFNEPLVHFVNIERQNRTRFFSPVKTAFDFFMLFYSDRFSLNEKTFKLIDNRPGSLPFIKMPHDYYREVQNVLDAFEDSEILELDHLDLEGSPVTLRQLKLVGSVKIMNSSEELFDLSAKLQKKGIKELKNQSVRITPQGDLVIS